MNEYWVLCIDDDEQFLASLEAALPQRVAARCAQFQCRFDFVSTPEELDELLAQEPRRAERFAMLIADQVMPRITGIQLIERLRRQRPGLAYVLLTGHAGLDSARYAINNRLLDAYATKPIEDMEQFALQVAGLLKQRHLDLTERARTEDLRRSHERIQAMHAAAEQVALLAKGIKCLDFEELVQLVTREVPRIFQAQSAVLCIPAESCPDGGCRTHRSGCPCGEEKLQARLTELPADSLNVIVAGPEGPCQAAGARPPSVIVPLDTNPRQDAGQRAYLCLCNIDPQAAGGDLLAYKGALIRDVLSANLVNARLYQQARHDSQIDSLTGVCTRRVLEQKLEAEHERASRYGRPFCVAIMDVDRFKEINDQLGHAAGDAALRTIAEVMAAQTRATDVLARYGGDEFVLLMPETALAEGQAAVERMRGSVSGQAGCLGEPLSISCGVAEWSAASGETSTDVLRRADAALYEAKRAGRNRVAVADPMRAAG